MDIGALLESCNFSVFWRILRGEYEPSDSPDEKFRNPEDVKRLLQPLNGFEQAVRHCTLLFSSEFPPKMCVLDACRVITATFQTIDGVQLIRLLGDITQGECLGFAQAR